MPDIDFGRISESLNEKSDRDLRNVDTTAKADAVIDYQEPTSANNYTWYRKYKSGWVEQGGRGTLVSSSYTASLPIAMADTEYFVFTGTDVVGVNNSVCSRKCTGKTTASVTITGTYGQGGGTNYDNGNTIWEVKGMAAN